METDVRTNREMIASRALVVRGFGQAVEESGTAATLIRDELAAGRATVVDWRLRSAGVRIDLLRPLAAFEPDG